MVKIQYLTTGHISGLEHLTIKELIDLHYQKINKKLSTTQILQTIHNIYAKKLGIPSVKVKREHDAKTTAYFTYNYSSKTNNVQIEIDSYAELLSNLLDVYCSIIHETKHAHQYYILHKYLNLGIVPKSNYEKAILLSQLFIEKNMTSANCPYYAMLNELDAFIFELEEMEKLVKGPFNDSKSIQYYYHQLFYFMDKLKYNREGLNNNLFHKAYKTLKTDLHNAKFNPELTEVMSPLIKDFNVDNAFRTFENKFNYFYDKLICSIEEAKANGCDIDFEKHGQIQYDKRLFLKKNSKLLIKYLDFIKNKYDNQDEPNI